MGGEWDVRIHHPASVLDCRGGLLDLFRRGFLSAGACQQWQRQHQNLEEYFIRLTEQDEPPAKGGAADRLQPLRR